MRKLLPLLFLLAIFQSAALARQDVNITFTRPQNTPYFIGAPEINIDAEEFTTVILKMKSNQSGTARLFWATNFDPQMNEPKSIWFFLDKSKDFKEYAFNLRSQNPYWAGFVGQILIYPDTGPEGIEIESAKAIPDNLITNIKSGWQEFWGPRGRVVIGSTINITPSSAIFGMSVNIYIYWLAGILFIVAYILHFIKQTSKEKDYFKAAKLSLTATIYPVFAALIISWLLLTLNADYNYFNIFKTNYSKYAGKSLEQKRALTYGQDYYDFLVFAKQKLPKQPVKFGILTSKYAGPLQPRIYLVPYILVDIKDKGLKYLLVFHPSPEQKIETEKFKLFEKFKDNQYILERIK